MRISWEVFERRKLLGLFEVGEKEKEGNKEREKERK